MLLTTPAWAASQRLYLILLLLLSFCLVLLLCLSYPFLLLAHSPDFFIPNPKRLGDEYFSWWYVQHMLPYGTGLKRMRLTSPIALRAIRDGDQGPSSHTDRAMALALAFMHLYRVGQK